MVLIVIQRQDMRTGALNERSGEMNQEGAMNRTVYRESSPLIPDDAPSLLDKIPGIWEIIRGTQFMESTV